MVRHQSVQPGACPSLLLPGPPDAALLIVQDAPVAHEGASLWRGDDPAEWRDTILSYHRRPSLLDDVASTTKGVQRRRQVPVLHQQVVGVEGRDGEDADAGFRQGHGQRDEDAIVPPSSSVLPSLVSLA